MFAAAGARGRGVWDLLEWVVWIFVYRLRILRLAILGICSSNGRESGG